MHYECYVAFVPNSYLVPVAPKIINPPKQVKILAGLSLTVNVDYVGEPTPDVTWTMEGRAALPDKLQVDNAENLTTRTSSLFVPSAKRTESGLYKIGVKNDIGRDEAVIEIVVQGEKLFSNNLYMFISVKHVFRRSWCS